MTTRYRVEYALKTHRRDQFIEWIKGLLAVPFVLHSQPTTSTLVQNGHGDINTMANATRWRYADIMQEVENLVNEHLKNQENGRVEVSKLKMLIPSIGTFFTPLKLKDAFLFEDEKSHISSRRFVAPSFNDVRRIMNTAQIMSILQDGSLELITFDGDVTLYDDGHNLTPDNPVIGEILAQMHKGVKIGIVTAAGYTEAQRYYERLHGLLQRVGGDAAVDAIAQNLIVMGGESSYLFTCDPACESKLRRVSRDAWALEEMRSWNDADIQRLLDVAEKALRDCVATLGMPADVYRKERAVGIVPDPLGSRLPREALEETVLVTQKTLEMCDVSKRVPFCAFNGGNDIFVDIGDKSWGVRVCQRFFGGIPGSSTLHVGDQFLSAGANDFKARLACTTAWIASPAETVQLLRDIDLLERQKKKN